MSKKDVAVAGMFGMAVGSAVLTYAQSAGDSNGDGFLEFSDGAVIDADELNTNFSLTANHVARFEDAIDVTSSSQVGLSGSPLDDETLYIFQDESGSGDHLNLRLYKEEGGDMLQMTDGVDYSFAFGVDATSNFSYLGDVSNPEALVISGNKLGINTTDPGSRLTIEASTAFNQFTVRSDNFYTGGWARGMDMQFRKSAGTIHRGFAMGVYGNADVYTGTYLSALEDDATPWATAQLFLNTSGNVGIGKNNPQAKLDISGAIRATDICDESGNNCRDISSGWGTSSQWITSGSNIYYTSGSVGIGASSPTSMLDVAGKISVTASSSETIGLGLQKVSSGNSILWYDGELNIKTSATGTSGDRVRITTAGSVGIGTTTPGAKLAVKTANGSGTGSMLLLDSGENSGSSVGLVQFFRQGTSKWTELLEADDSLSWYNGSARVITATSAGRLGVGTTSPSNTLHVAGTGIRSSGDPGITVAGASNSGRVMFTNSTSGHTWQVGTSGSIGTDDWGIADYTAGTQPVTIKTSTGYVGINTNDPSTTLHVQGNARFSSYMHLGAGESNRGYIASNLVWNGSTYTKIYTGASYAGGWKIDSAGGGYGDIYFRNLNWGTDSSAVADSSLPVRMVIKTDGNVGINTLFPTHELTILNTTTGINPALDLRSAGTSSGDGPAMVLTDSSGEQDFMLYTDSANEYTRVQSRGVLALHAGTVGVSGTNEFVTIATDGKVGIGNISPKGKLEVRNTTAYDGVEANFSADSLTLYGSVGSADGQYFGGITWANDSRRRAGIASVMEHTDSDHVGIAFFTQGTDGSGPMYESMRISRSGNVGINTTTPSYTLDVNGSLRAYGITDASDERLKHHILPLEDAAEGIACLQGVTYYWNDSQIDPDLQIGLIAQDVEQCFPELVDTDDRGYKSVAYSRLVVPLVETAKEQQQETELLRLRLSQTDKKLEATQTTLEQTRSALDATNARVARLEALLAGKR